MGVGMRFYVIASVMIIIGLICIAYGGSLDVDAWQKPYISDLSSALLVGGLLSLLFKIFQEKESEAKLRKLLRIHDSVDELGLIEILPEVQGFNFTEIIEDADSLAVVMNDGLRWVGNNTISLSKRFGKSATTEFFTVDPESDFVNTLAEKVSCPAEDLKRKIKDSWQRVEDAYNLSEKRSGFVIYAIKTFPTRSIFLTEDVLVETPYQTAAGRAKIPLYLYRKVARTDSPYYFAKNDVEHLRAEARIIKKV